MASVANQGRHDKETGKVLSILTGLCNASELILDIKIPGIEILCLRTISDKLL